MRINVSFKYLERSEYIDMILEKNIKKVERRVQMFKKDSPVHVSIHLEKNPHREQYFCRVQLYLPTSKVLVIEENGFKVEVAINKSFLGLDKQISKLKYKKEKFLRQREQKIREIKYSNYDNIKEDENEDEDEESESEEENEKIEEL